MVKKIEKGCLTCKFSTFERTDTGRLKKKVPGRCSFKIVSPVVPWFREEEVARSCSSYRHGIWPGDGKECKCWDPSDVSIVSNNGFPQYVKLYDLLGHICAVGHVGNGLYWRDAGCWSIQIENKDGKLIAVDGKQYKMEHMDGKEVYPCTREEWAEDNKGYIHGSDMLREINSWKEYKDGKTEIPY